MAALRDPTKLTVVVAPQNVIITGIEKRATEAGVPLVQRWTGHCLRNLGEWVGAPQCGLLLVSADLATTQAFRSFLRKQFSVFKCVHRVFMDEVHLSLQEFRSVMLDLWRICPRPCTWVFLTGSLALDEEPLVCNIVDARPLVLRPDTAGFGVGTARLNLEYVVRFSTGTKTGGRHDQRL